MIRVVVADDHAIVREGIKALLHRHPDIVIVAEASDGRETVDAVQRHAADVALIDLTMPSLNGIEAVKRLRAAAPSTRVIVLSMHAAPEYVRPALRAGAHGYLVKGSGLDDLVRAIRAVAGGERFLDMKAQAIVDSDQLEPSSASDDLERLTPREREVLQMVAEGHTNREIADRLGLSPKTIDVHRTSMMKKLDLHNAQALTRYAIRRGLISGE